MSPVPQLTQLQLAYKLEGDDEVHVTGIHNKSLIAWDETRGKRQWPASTEAPSLWQTFILWHHLSRSGAYAGDFNKFRDECIALEVYEEDDEKDRDDPTYGEVAVDPTQLAVAPDSSSP